METNKNLKWWSVVSLVLVAAVGSYFFTDSQAFQGFIGNLKTDVTSASDKWWCADTTGATEEGGETDAANINLCDCKDKTFKTEDGKEYKCPVKFGDSKEYKEGDKIVTIWKEKEYNCKAKWKCEDGKEVNWTEVYAACDDLVLSYEKTCSKSFKTYTKTVKTCKAFLGESWYKDFKAFAKENKYKCVDQKTCDKFAKLAAEGKTSETINGVTLDEASAACNAAGYSDGSEW